MKYSPYVNQKSVVLTSVEDLCLYLEAVVCEYYQHTAKVPYKGRSSRPGKPLQHVAVLASLTLLLTTYGGSCASGYVEYSMLRIDI